MHVQIFVVCCRTESSHTPYISRSHFVRHCDSFSTVLNQNIHTPNKPLNNFMISFFVNGASVLCSVLKTVNIRNEPAYKT